MRTTRTLPVAVALTILLGCAADGTKADDGKPGGKPAAGEKPADKPAGEKPADGADKKPEGSKKVFRATVTDRFGTAAFVIADARLWVPEVSLFGGEGGEYKKVVVVKHGAAEIEVPFDEVQTITLKLVKEDRIDVVVTFRAADKAGKQLDGTIKSNLQLHGHYEKSNLSARLKLREINEITLEEEK